MTKGRVSPAELTAAPTPLRSEGQSAAVPSFAAASALIFGVALVIRLTHVWLLSRSPFFTVLLGDARGYDEWAVRIAAGEWIGKDVFYQAPLYPYFLAVLYRLFGHSFVAVRVVQSLIGAGSCALLGLAANRFFSRRVGLIAGIALAIYAPAIFFDALIQKSVLDLFFLTLALSLIARLVDEPQHVGLWLGLGVSMGGLSLTRENALVFVAVILWWALWAPRLTTAAAPLTQRLLRQAARAPRGKATFRAVSAFVAGLAIVLLPVAIRNFAVGGGFYLTTSQFGPNFYIGNNPRADGTYASLRFGRGAPEYERTDATELAEHATGRHLTPGDVSSYWTGRALDFMTTQPLAWLRLMGRKVLLLVNRTEMLDTESQESHAEYSWVLRVGGWFGHVGIVAPLALVGLVLAWPARRRLAILYWMTGLYAASVLMFYVFARYRLPLIPLLLLFAAEAIAALPSWIAAASPRQRALMGAAVCAVAVLTNWPVLSKPLMMAITETNLATALQIEGRTDEAAVHYRRAIELQPEYAPAYNNLGVMQRATGNLDAAIATYRQALALNGDYPDAHYNLANALLERNRPKEAAEHFSIALRSIPDSAGVSNNLGIALAAQNRPQDAVSAFRAAVAADPGSAVARRNLADGLTSAGDLAEGIAEYKRAIAADPKDSATHYNLGLVLLQSGDLPGAIEELRTAVDLAPASTDALNNLGVALGSSGDLDGAIARFKQVLTIKPDAADARRNLEMAEQARAQQGHPVRR
jgi:tetratricopeptide (TPR) repeat protein